MLEGTISVGSTTAIGFVPPTQHLAEVLGRVDAFHQHYNGRTPGFLLEALEQVRGIRFSNTAANVVDVTSQLSLKLAQAHLSIVAADLYRQVFGSQPFSKAPLTHLVSLLAPTLRTFRRNPEALPALANREVLDPNTRGRLEDIEAHLVSSFFQTLPRSLRTGLQDRQKTVLNALARKLIEAHIQGRSIPFHVSLIHQVLGLKKPSFSEAREGVILDQACSGLRGLSTSEPAIQDMLRTYHAYALYVANPQYAGLTRWQRFASFMVK